MTERYLTEPAAWRRIAEAFAEKKHCYRQLAYSGLCYAVNRLKDEGAIPSRTWQRMRTRLWSTFNPDYAMGGWWWPIRHFGEREDVNHRVAACLLLALLAEEDV